VTYIQLVVEILYWVSLDGLSNVHCSLLYNYGYTGGDGSCPADVYLPSFPGSVPKGFFIDSTTTIKWNKWSMCVFN